MTTEELKEYYADLLIMQYSEQPNAYDMIKALVGPVIMDQLPSQVESAFNVTGTNPAVGVQLDVIGKYAGVTRTGNGFNGPISLNDADFLKLVQMAIIRNRSGSSLATIQLLLNQFFEDEIFVFDYANMNMSYLIDTVIGSQDLIDLFVTQNLLPKPMGVGISVIADDVINLYFGYVTYDAPTQVNSTPFNNYDTYDTSWRWVSYSNAV